MLCCFCCRCLLVESSEPVTRRNIMLYTTRLFCALHPTTISWIRWFSDPGHQIIWKEKDWSTLLMVYTRLTFGNCCVLISVKSGLQFDSDEDRKKKQCCTSRFPFKIRCNLQFYDLLIQHATTLFPVFKLYYSYTDPKTLN